MIHVFVKNRLIHRDIRTLVYKFANYSNMVATSKRNKVEFISNGTNFRMEIFYAISTESFDGATKCEFEKQRTSHSTLFNIHVSKIKFFVSPLNAI